MTQFVGREADLQTLHEQLQQSDRPAITALRGMGGIGKTELALQYAHFHWQQGTYPGGICWLLAREEIATQIVSFAKATLGLNLPDGLELAEQVAYCWRNWTAGDVLVVVDDVTDYGAIKDYLPPREPRFWVLLTTRLQLGTSIRTFEIEVLTETASLQLLESLIGAERIDAERATATALCEWLGYLPLGLELVGRYLAQKPDLSLVKMQQRLEKQRLAARALCGRAADMTAEHESVAAAFELSWQELAEPARQLGYVLSLFALAPIPWNLVEQSLPQWDEEELEDQQSNLVNCSLLQRVGEGSYQLHQLVREFFGVKREESATGQDSPIAALKQQVCQVLVKVAKQLSGFPTQQELLSITPAMPHVAEAATTLAAALEDEVLIYPFVGLGRFYEGQGAYAQAEPWYEQCLTTVRIRLGQEHPVVAQSLNNLALLYDHQGRYKEAEPLYQKALVIYERLLGQEHLVVAASLHNLAILYDHQGRYKKAELLCQKALVIYERLLGQEHPAVAENLNSLASLYEHQGRYLEAESLYQKALDIYQRLGQEYPAVAHTLNNLAGLYSYQERYEDAELLYQKALAMKQQLLGQGHPDLANSLNNLALLYEHQGRYLEAESLYQKALAIYQRLGQEHPNLAIYLNNLASLYDNQGRYEEAEPLYQQSLQILNQHLGLGFSHPSMKQVRNNLANFYSTIAERFKVLGDYDKVNEYLEKAIALRTHIP